MANRDELIQEAIDAIVVNHAAAAADVATPRAGRGHGPERDRQRGLRGRHQLGRRRLRGAARSSCPQLMLAAQAMDAATAVCNAALEGGAGEKKGTVIVGTVQGDVHDIGKAIVIAYLKAHGYAVTD